MTLDATEQAPVKACLAVLYAATIEARAMGWHGSKHGLSTEEGERLAKLMDAVHNLPQLLALGKPVDASRLRASLVAYDEEYGYVSRVRMVEAYDRAVAE